MAISERYPVLKADTQFLQLQEELVNTVDRIQRARRFYNANVCDYNNSVESFPSNLLAGAFNFGKCEFFEIDAAMREPVKVSL